MVPLRPFGATLGPIVLDLVATAMWIAAVRALALIAHRADARLGDLARAGWLFGALGGLARVAWGFTAYWSDADLTVLERAQLGFLAPGMLFLAVAFLAATRVEWAARPGRVLSRMGAALLVLAVAFGASQSSVPGFGVALAVIAVASLMALLARAVAVADEHDRQEAVGLLGVTALGSVVLAALGATPPTEALTWITRSLSLGVAAAFAVGARRLSRRWGAEG